MITTETLIDILKENKVKIDFVKQDGSMRTMTCTLHKDMIVPYERKTQDAKPKPANPDLISVWSVEDKGWRSFKMSSVKEIYLPEAID